MSDAYQLLPSGPGHEKQPSPRRSRFSRTVTALLFIVLVETTALATVSVHFRQSSVPKPPRLYSPAQHVVHDVIKVYPSGFRKHKTPFQVPSSYELDVAWEDLYQFGVSRIPKTEAALLPNKTSPIPGDPGFYIAELDVFHDLHCLNTVRKALDPAHYPEWNITASERAADHISHCIEWIRHGIMCQADTSVIVYQWDLRFNETFAYTDVPHTCRGFGAIQQWAKQNQMTGEFDYKAHVEDGIPVPPYVY
ncbi:hypothetical protein DFH09DRAFT_1331037 [Mycena vulgaris]|nr:hypothetical protein DFH09DRAFT_1331037 [Mycena vulgaris]